MGNIMNTYNFQVPISVCSFPSTHLIGDWFSSVFADQHYSFKATISLGLVLLNKETTELQYYYSSQNNQRLFEPTTITNETDRDNFISRISECDLMECIIRQRPTSKYIVKAVSNVTFFIIKFVGTPIGTPPDAFPRHASQA